MPPLDFDIIEQDDEFHGPEDFVTRLASVLTGGGVDTVTESTIEPIDIPIDPVMRLSEGLDIPELDVFRGDQTGQVPRPDRQRETREIEDISAQERALVQHGVEEKFKPGNWMDIYDNGRIPLDALKPVGDGHYARPDVARAFKQMRRAAKRAGLTISVTDSYRTYDQQVALEKEKGEYWTAEPGTSNHGWGIAFDLNVNDPKVLAWLRNNGGRFGFEELRHSDGSEFEPWHWEFNGDYDGAYPARPKNRRRRPQNVRHAKPEPTAPGLVKTSDPLVVLPLSFGQVFDEVFEPARQRERSEGRGVSEDNPQALARQMAAAMGWTGRQWKALNAIIDGGTVAGLTVPDDMAESHWDPAAENEGSGALGIGQRLPSAHPWDPGEEERYRENVRYQIRWMLNYVAGRYKTPMAALRFKVQNGWY